MRTMKETKFELPLSVVVYLFHITIVILEIIPLIETNKDLAWMADCGHLATATA